MSCRQIDLLLRLWKLGKTSRQQKHKQTILKTFVALIKRTQQQAPPPVLVTTIFKPVSKHSNISIQEISYSSQQR